MRDTILSKPTISLVQKGRSRKGKRARPTEGVAFIVGGAAIIKRRSYED